MALLEVDSISKSFGGVAAVKDFSMVQGREEISGIIGPNGAGKTTAFNLITGVQPLDSGRIFFDGTEITSLPSHCITRLGIARTFQNIRLFHNLNVLENLMMAGGTRLSYSTWEEMFRLPRVVSQEKRLEKIARSYLSYFHLEKYSMQRPDSLPYGLQRRLELARALMLEPSLLLLDEPAAGLNPKEIHNLIELIYKIKEEKRLSIIIVEHHMELVMNICSKIHVLDFGLKIAEGKPEEIKKNPEVLQAYLGEEV